MKDPEKAEAVLVESKSQRSFRYWNLPRNLARSAVEFVQVPNSCNPKPPFLIFATRFDISYYSSSKDHSDRESTAG